MTVEEMRAGLDKLQAQLEIPEDRMEEYRGWIRRIERVRSVEPGPRLTDDEWWDKVARMESAT